MKKGYLILILLGLVCSCAYSASVNTYDEDFSIKVDVPDTSSKIVTKTQPFDNSFSSIELTQKMGNGINLGNTMEAYRGYNASTKMEPTYYERLWGQPEAQPRHFYSFADTGFKSVRIPIAWTNMMDYEKGNYVISPKMLDRVEEVVNMALDAGLYVIINDHWDGGWWGMFGSAKKEHREMAVKMYKSMWTQIANRFKNYSEKLIFEGGNEEHGDGFNLATVFSNKKSGVLNENQKYDCANKLNQCFVDVVRSTGANNKERFLLIPGFNTDIDKTAHQSRFKMPEDTAKNKLMISVHYYTPSDYCILAEDASWGKVKLDWGTDSEKIAMELNFKKMKEFVDNGYGVVIGEYGVSLTKDYKIKNGTASWLQNVLDNCSKYNYCPMLWDCSSLFLRTGRLGFTDAEIAEIYKSRE